MRDVRLQVDERSRPCPPNASACLWPDHLGLPRGKYIPSRFADHGVRHCKGTWALGFDREMTPYTTGSGWEVGLPDMEARFEAADIRPGWEEGTRVVVADLTSDGAPVAVSPRAALRKAVADWDAKGLTSYAGIELEAYLLEPDGQGGFRPIDTPGAFVYGTGTAVDPERGDRRHLARRRGLRARPSSRSTPSTTTASSS